MGRTPSSAHCRQIGAPRMPDPMSRADSERSFVARPATACCPVRPRPQILGRKSLPQILGRKSLALGVKALDRDRLAAPELYEGGRAPDEACQQAKPQA